MTSFYGRSLVSAASLAILAAAVATAALGTWQWRRADEKAALQQARDAAVAAPPRTLVEPLPPPGSIDGMRIVAVGRFVPELSVFLDNRTRNGVAGFHLLTPLRIAGSDRHLLVLRGFVPRDLADRTRLPAPPTPTDEVRVEGLAQIRLDQPMQLGEEPPPEPGQRLWQHFEFDRFARWSGRPVYPVILRQTVQPAWQDGLARDWAQPGVTVERHRAYSAQWFTMTAALMMVWLVLVVRGARRLAEADGATRA